MAEGTVKWFDPSRGFGYITPDGGGKDVFVQHTAITAPLADGFKIVEPGARVTFAVWHGDRGPEAVRVAAAAGGWTGRVPAVGATPGNASASGRVGG